MHPHHTDKQRKHGLSEDQVVSIYLEKVKLIQVYSQKVNGSSNPNRSKVENALAGKSVGVALKFKSTPKTVRDIWSRRYAHVLMTMISPRIFIFCRALPRSEMFPSKISNLTRMLAALGSKLRATFGMPKLIPKILLLRTNFKNFSSK
jgi:hypothetical protein